LTELTYVCFPELTQRRDLKAAQANGAGMVIMIHHVRIPEKTLLYLPPVVPA
jgi:hypothetical protein